MITSTPTSGTGKASANDMVQILCVDDEPAILEGLALDLRRRFKLHLATSGAQGIELLGREPGIAVVVSDMHMPGMDGAAFLSQVRTLIPNSVRILLTGQADMNSAIAAVNEGQIFRFLTKPCPPKTLLATIEAAAEHHRLVAAEKVLLEHTLRGSVQALTEVLALTNPACFGRATRMRKTVCQVSERLNLPGAWQVEMAAMLSQLGGIILPPETVEREFNGQPLSEQDVRMLARAPAVTEQLLAKIPRLEGVRAILAAHGRIARGASLSLDVPGELAQAARVLALAADFDALETQGQVGALAIATLRGRTGRYDLGALDALAACQGADLQEVVRELPVSGLHVGMVLVDDLHLKNGTLVVTRGFEITASSLERMRNFERNIKEPVRVRMPRAAQQACSLLSSNPTSGASVT